METVGRVFRLFGRKPVKKLYLCVSITLREYIFMINNDITRIIAEQTSLRPVQIEHTVALIEDGATVPFISRYRKEATGNLDEVQIAAVKDLLESQKALEARKQTILATIEKQGALTAELRQRIAQTWDATELEDIYLPYKRKRKTRATAAKEKGLEPLTHQLLKLQAANNVASMAQPYVKGEVASIDDALQGARDIIAEIVSEDEKARNTVRKQFRRYAVISSHIIKGKEEEAAKYRTYFDFKERLNRCSSHRLLAMRRGEAEGYLKVSIRPDDNGECEERLERLFVHGRGEAAQQVALAVADACKRLLLPSIETEFATESKRRADEEAIQVFTSNLRELLLAAPLGQKRILAIDPGFRTGCKVVCLDSEGNLLHNETIYPHPPHAQRNLATRKLCSLIEQYKIEAIAIGNGTAGRETEDLIHSLPIAKSIEIHAVNEDGASVYSASPLARKEFPEYDVTVRGAVSIGRRLMDPLAELVKIEPRSIGVGQYQHDVNQGELKKSLDATVEHCVNTVGVNLNTAGAPLLQYVSGLSLKLAQNIVDYRAANGAFASRQALKAVARMGEKTFEQCAGFLRIPSSENPLDNTAVHPESYYIVEKMAKDLNVSIAELIADKTLRNKIKLENYVNEKVGMPTLQDIMKELDKPGRDMRGKIKPFSFDSSIRTFEDLHEGMILPGIVTNVTKFGCFVDIGIHEDGLVHISELSDTYVADPSAIVKVNQQVKVRIKEIDAQRRRISLSMRGTE